MNCYRDLVRPSDDDQVGRPAVIEGTQEGGQLFGGDHRLAADGDDEVAPAHPGPVGGALRLDGVDQQPVPVRQAYGVAQTAGNLGRGQGDSEPYPAGHLAPGQGIDALLQVAADGQGQIEPLALPMGVYADQVAGAVDQGPAGGPGDERRAVLERPGNRAPPGATEADTKPGNEPGTGPQAPAARPGQPDDDVAQGGNVVGPGQRRAPAVSTDRTARSPSTSAPATVAVATRPSSNETATSPRRL